MNEVQIQMQIHWRQTQIQIQPTRIASLKRTTTFGDAAAFIQISSSVLLLAALRELAGKNQFRLFAFFLQKNKKKKTEWNEWKKNKPTCMSPSPLRPTYGWFCWVFVWFLPRLPTTCAPRSPPPPAATQRRFSPTTTYASEPWDFISCKKANTRATEQRRRQKKVEVLGCACATQNETAIAMADREGAT